MDGELHTDLKTQSEPAEVIQFLLTESGQELEERKKKVSVESKPHCDSANSSDQQQSVTMVTLPDGSTALVHQMLQGTFMQAVDKINEDAIAQTVPPKFVDGQPVQLEDGTTAYIHSSHKEGLQVVQLEDGTTAYISSTLTLDTYDGSRQTTAITHSEESEDVDKIVLTRTLSDTVRASNRAIALGDRAFRCSVDGCGRLYTTQHHLKVHERSHTGDRPFRCEAPGCHKAFATGYGLKSHTRVHTGEKPYRCIEEYCDKAFKTSGDLQKHVRTHTGERPFKCPFEGCNRSFTTSNIRKVHVRTHTGERPYTCPEEGCGRAFASATNYKNHIRIHTGEKPYVCTVLGCNKRFTEYSSLYKHHVVHTHSKPYACTLCGKHYRQTSTLAMHTRTAHGLVDASEVHVCEEGALLESDSTEKVQESSKKRQRIQLMVASTDVNDPMAIVALQAAQQAAEQAIQQVHQQQAQIEVDRTTPQILVVADAAQFAALQQLSQQQLSIASNDTVVSGDVTLDPTKESCPIITYSVAPI